MALRLLVVDDNRDSADSLAILLKLEGHETRVAYDGKQAIDAALAFRPEVLIVDLAMPVLDGFQVAEQLRPIPEFQEAHFVALTGHTEQRHLDEASKVQFDEYLLKPVEMPILLKILSEVNQHIGK